MTPEREEQIRRSWRAAALKGIAERNKADAERWKRQCHSCTEPAAELFCEFCGSGPECIVCGGRPS